MKYARVVDGFVVGTGLFSEHPGDGWVDATDMPPLSAVDKIAYSNGKFSRTGQSWVAANTELTRAAAYPTVGDQLGAIWKAIAPLIEHPEAEAILAKIQAVKDANPKPSN